MRPKDPGRQLIGLADNDVMDYTWFSLDHIVHQPIARELELESAQHDSDH
jgi:hypothetical protein